MSMPNIPDITPDIDLKRKDVINLLLASIALEELSLSHILNAEAEKVQAVLKHKGSLHHLLAINNSVERTLRDVIKSQMLLQFKLEEVLSVACETESKEQEECEEEDYKMQYDHKEEKRHEWDSEDE